jgi:hypothetical protein
MKIALNAIAESGIAARIKTGRALLLSRDRKNSWRTRVKN